jgi:chaperone required for assembly of F1-ATPase
MKRFYTDIATAPVEGGHAVLLDGKPIRTPQGQPLHLPHAALADAIAEEWRAQGDDIKPLTMPLMQLAATAIDHIPKQRDAIIQRLLAFTDTDLLCLRDDAVMDLRARQDKHWQPPLDWLKKTHEITLNIGEGLKVPAQPAEARMGFEKIITGLDDWSLVGVSEAASLSGSLVLALGLYENAITPQKAFEAAELEGLHQASRWGEDAEAVARHAAIQKDLEHISRWLKLARGQ